MARKKVRVPSPPPPTPPQEEPRSDEGEEEEATPATQKAAQNPKPPSTAAAGTEEESSDSETDANAFQLREVARSPGKPSGSKKAAARKPKAESGKKRQATESIPSGGKAKKAKADAAPLSGKEPSEPNAASSKGKKRYWTTEDEIKVLEALVSHIKANGTQPSAGDLIAAVGHSLERKSCSKTEMYEKVRSLKQRHEREASAGTLPANGDDLRKFNLSEAVWGESAKEAAAALISQNVAASSKGNKGQTNKVKKAGSAKKASSIVNENVKTLTETRKRQATKAKVDRDAKGRLSKKAATADTPVKIKKQGNHKEDDAKTATTKDTTNAASRGFDELQNLYPNLTSVVESIQAQHPCGEALKRAFQFISDEKASALESKIKKERVAEMKMEIRRADAKKPVTSTLIGLLG